MNKTEEHIELMLKHKLNPDNYKVLFETKDKLVLLHRRGSRRTILKGE